ncbi:MAG TPA: NUDIX hydrolase [Crinalium sp.]|jgi:8-oxo-dGTP pyrophosphatase MutT (NUDIX family)
MIHDSSEADPSKGETRGPWIVKDSIQKYTNSFITVCEDQVLQPDGQIGTYATVRVKRGVTVLPIDEHNQVYLVQQFRYALNQESLEAVSGSLDDDAETPLDAAKRELHEEVGIEAAEWIDLGVVNPDTSIVMNPMYLFVAKQLTFTEPDPDGGEVMESVKLSLEEAIAKVINSEITHAPSCVVILKAFSSSIHSVL